MVLITIMQITNFDLFFTDTIMEYVFDFGESEPFSAIFEEADFETSNYVLLAGSLFLIAVSFLIYAVLRETLLWFIRYFDTGFCLMEKLGEMDYVVTVLRFLLESCLELSLAGLITVVKLDSSNWANFSDGFSTVLAFVNLVGLVGAPIFLIVQAHIFHKYYDTNQEVRDKYKTLFEDYRRRSLPSLLYNVVFFLRRYFMVIILIYLPLHKNLQIFAQLLSTLFVMCYIGYVEPYKEKARNTFEWFNELTVLVASYALLTFTPWVDDNDTRYLVGWVMIGVVALNMVGNITMMLVTKLCQAVTKTMLWYTKRKVKADF